MSDNNSFQMHPASASETRLYEKFIADAKRHVDSCTDVPSQLRPALATVETNFLFAKDSNTTMLPAVVVDYDRATVPMPEDCDGHDLPRFLWQTLNESNGESVYFGYEGDDDTLAVLFMTHSEFFAATADVLPNGGLGDWKVQRVAACKDTNNG